MQKKLLGAAAALAFVLAASDHHPAQAQDWHEHGDIHHFHDHDFDHWRGGHWFNGFHEGRNGWWWIVDGGWYFYPAPVYPYPDPYTPPTVVEQAPPPGANPATPSVYYCTNPPGYYPYVPQCTVPWQRVASAAAATVVVPQPAPPPVPLDQRAADRRQLDMFTAAFHGTNLADPHARTELRDLEKQISSFRKSLYSRKYNALDISRDADRLAHEVAAQRKRLSSHPPAPPVVMVPPGTTVVMPPQ